MRGSEPQAERRVFRPDARTEVDEELEFHVAMRARQHMEAGMSRDEAERAARSGFRDYDGVAAECRALAEERDRQARKAELSVELGHDVRYALRQLRRAPGFAAAAVLTLALGIGGTAMIFGALEGVVLRPLQFPDADRLVVPMTERVTDRTRWSVGFADYEDWRRNGVFESVAVYRAGSVNVSGGEEAQHVDAARVTEDFFRVLRVAPVLGGVFTAADHEPGAPARVILSHGLWQSAFGGDPGIVGRSVRIAGRPADVAGVMPEGMSWPVNVGVFRPLQVTPEDRADFARRDNYIFFGIARLAPGRTLEATRAQLDGLARRVAAEEPATRGDVTVTAVSLNEFTVGETVARTLWVLLAAVAVVLLIGCVNIANLLLGRSAARERELAIRTALGASRGRVVRQLITESVVLALAGGALGVLLAYGGMRLLVRFAPAGIPRIDQVGVNPLVLGFAVVVSLLCALLFGVLPAQRAARRSDHSSVTRGTARSTGDVRAGRGRAGLIVAEMALAVVLLAGAGLLVQSFLRLQSTNPGFRAANLLTFEVSLQGERYSDAAGRGAAFAELTERLGGLAGVEGAAIASGLPLGGGGFYLGRSFLPEGRAEPPNGEAVAAMWNVVSPGYFATLDIPLLAGREFTAQDHADAVPVMIVNREFARAMFAAGDPLGQRVRSWRDENVYREIVGVVDDVRYFGAGDEIRPLVFVPHAQDAWSGMAVVLRTAGPPLELASAVRSELRAFEPTVGIASVQTMEQVLAESVAGSRFTALLIGVFACIALVLAVVGIYGVLSYGVAQRSREIGIRMALGARRGEVLGMIVREAGGVVAAGIALGLAGAFAVTRLAGALLYEVSATDPVTFAAVAVLLAGVALLASLLPARRAASVHPASTLRAD